MASMLHDRALTVPVDCSHCTEPDTQRPSSYQERSGTASRKCGPQKTPARKAKLLAAAARLPKDSAGRFIGSGIAYQRAVSMFARGRDASVDSCRQQLAFS